MNFIDEKEKASVWCRSQGNDTISMIDACESERKLTFIYGSLNYYLLIPESSNENPKVWSDRDDVLQHLGDIVDRLHGCKLFTIECILGMIQSALQPLLDKNSGATSTKNQSASNADIDEGISDDEYMDYDDDDGLGDDYYGEEDIDALQEQGEKNDSSTLEGAAGASQKGSSVAIQRLMKDMRNLAKIDPGLGIQGQPVGDDMFTWEVKLKNIPKDTLLGKDMENYAKKYKRENCILMEMTFPKDYPFSPPFVRIRKPRFKFLTGHVTIGGSICMQLLTRSGWTPGNDIESALVQIRSEILSDDTARLDSHPDREYDIEQARAAFQRMVQRYGW